MLRSLTALNLHFPQGGRSPQELQQIAHDWMEDLQAFSPEVIAQAVKCARRELDFFPSTRQMIELCARAKGDLERWQQRQALPAPEQTFESVCENGLKRIAEIQARLKIAVITAATTRDITRSYLSLRYRQRL